MSDMTPWEANQFEEDMRSAEYKHAGERDQGRLAWFCFNCGERHTYQIDGSNESCLQCGSHVKLERI